MVMPTNRTKPSKMMHKERVHWICNAGRKKVGMLLLFLISAGKGEDGQEVQVPLSLHFNGTSVYSAKLLKKPDQCRAVYACSHLFWLEDHETIQDGERVLRCLKRALKIANSAQQMTSAARGSTGTVTLFIEILNKYLYFFEKGIPQITVESVESMIQLIKNEESLTSDPSAESFLASTLRFMEFQKQKGGAIGDRYEQVKV